jgi:RimJ/RimL family protein N-acetyltransferase
MAGPVELETKRLLMRRFALDDAAAYLPLVSLPDVIRFTGDRALRSVDEAVELLETRALRDYDLYGYGRMACIEKTTGRLIGFSGLKYLDDMDETDVGYRFLPDAWGKGYATESSSAIMNAQPKQLGLTRIIGLVEPENLGSVSVLKKLGLTYERRFAVEDHGELDLYGISLEAA